MIEPIEQQRAILNAFDALKQDILVVARPGRGKTTTALILAQHIIRNESIHDSQEVLFLTFSRNSVYQIKHAGGKNLETNVRKRLLIATYHSFMWWLISSFGRFHGLPVKLSVMSNAKFRAANEIAIQEKIKPDQKCTYFAKKFSAISYDEFAPLAIKLLSNSNNLRTLIQHKFPVIVVDEFQDTNAEQWEFIKLISKNSRLICFADPDQMIYTWRGACEDRLKQFIDERQAKEYPLQEKCMRTGENNLLNFAESILDNKYETHQIRMKYKRRFLRYYLGWNALGYYLKNIILSEFYKDFQKRECTSDIPTIAFAAYSNSSARDIQQALGKSTQKSPKTYKCSMLEDAKDESLRELLIHIAMWIAEKDPIERERAIQLIGGMLISNNSRVSTSIEPLLYPKESFCGYHKPSGNAKFVIDEFKSTNILNIKNSDEAIAEAVGLTNRLRKGVKPIFKAIPEADLITCQNEILRMIENIESNSVRSDLKSLRDKLDADRSRREVLGTVTPIRGIISSTLHKLKGREFDYVCIVTIGNDKLRGASDSEKDARRLMYVALTRARYDARILYLKSNPCFLLDPYLSANTSITEFIKP